MVSHKSTHHHGATATLRDRLTNLEQRIWELFGKIHHPRFPPVPPTPPASLTPPVPQCLSGSDPNSIVVKCSTPDGRDRVGAREYVDALAFLERVVGPHGLHDDDAPL